LKILETSITICIGCGCELLYTEYKPGCLYQFTFDRINTMSNNNLVEIKSSNTILQGIVFKYDPNL